MSKILFIQASPRKERSKSIMVGEALVEAYRKKNPIDQVRRIDLFQANLPSFDGPAAEAKYNILHQKPHSQEQQKAWSVIESIIDEFKSADKYVFALGMWNFGIPYRLKQYIDILVQPGYTFRYDPASGYRGLVTGKPAVIVK